MSWKFTLLLGFVGPLLTVIRSTPQEGTRPPAEQPAPQQILDGRLTGFELPANAKISERARKLTYTNPSGQNLAARWVDGEIVYRVSLGKLRVDPKTTKVAKEYLAVYAAPKPDDPSGPVEQVPGQLSIYDTAPGDEGYSPIWHYHYVVVPRSYQANTLRSEADVLASGYQVVPVDVFSN